MDDNPPATNVDAQLTLDLFEQVAQMRAEADTVPVAETAARADALLPQLAGRLDPINPIHACTLDAVNVSTTAVAGRLDTFAVLRRVTLVMVMSELLTDTPDVIDTKVAAWLAAWREDDVDVETLDFRAGRLLSRFLNVHLSQLPADVPAEWLYLNDLIPDMAASRTELQQQRLARRHLKADLLTRAWDIITTVELSR